MGLSENEEKDNYSKETGIRFESIHYYKISKVGIVEYIRRLNENNSINRNMQRLPLLESLAKNE